MGKTYIKSDNVKSATYNKNDTSFMYGYLNKGYTISVKHTEWY